MPNDKAPKQELENTHVLMFWEQILVYKKTEHSSLKALDEFTYHYSFPIIFSKHHLTW